MKCFKKILSCLIFVMCFVILTGKVKADFNTADSFTTCHSGGYSNSVGSTPHNLFCKLFDSEGNIVYCLEIEKEISGGTKHIYQNTVEGKGQACGVLKAMEKGLISTPASNGTHYYKTVSSNENFYDIQKLIWDYEGTTASCSKTLPPTTSTSTTNLEQGSLGISSSQKSMTIKSINGVDYYIATISLNPKNISNYEIKKSNDDLIVSTTESGENVTTSNVKTLYARMPVLKVTSNTTYTVSFSAEYNSSNITTTTSTSTITPFIQKFWHADNRQLLGIIGLKRSTTTETKTTPQKDDAKGSVELTVTLPKLTLKKVDVSGNTVKGATVKITKDGKDFQTPTLTNGTLSISQGLSYGKYCVTEVSAPSGYVKTDVSSCVTLSATNPNGTITITNRKTSVSFLKVDATSQKPLAGATLQILDKDSKVILNENNQPKYQWISTTEKYVIDGLPVGTYYLKETAAPSGYSLNSELIKFTINEDGSVTSDKQTDEETKVIIVENKKTVTSFSKQDATTGKELPGATLEILDANKKQILDKDGKPMYKWVSTNEPHIIEGLPVGKYYLKETIAPEGYALTEEMVAFEVKSDGTITKVVMKNTPKIKVPDTAGTRSIVLIVLGILLSGAGIGIITYTTIKNKKNSKL